MKTAVALSLLSATLLQAQTVELARTPAREIPAVGDNGAVNFERPVGALLLRQGDMLVADATADVVSRIRGTSAVASLGRAGDGPGEFRMIGSMSRCGADSALVYDMALQRFTFVVDGRIDRQSVAAINPALVSCSGANTLILRRPGKFPTAADRVGYVSAELILQSAHGSVKLADVPAFDYVAAIGVTFPRPLGAVTKVALGSQYAFVATGQSAAIDAYPLGGGPPRSIRVPSTPRKPAAANIEAAADYWASFQPDAASRAAIKHKMMTAPMPEWLPPYSNLLVDPRGLLWVTTSIPGDSQTQLVILTDAGKVAGRIALTEQLELLDVEQSHFVGLVREDDGGQVIKVYEIKRGK